MIDAISFTTPTRSGANGWLAWCEETSMTMCLRAILMRRVRESAQWTAERELTINFGATGGGLILQEGAAQYFSLGDGAVIESVRVEENTVVLTTAAVSAAASVSFVDVPGDIAWLVNDLGIGAFAFYEFPITP